MSKCRHLSISEEAYTSSNGRDFEPSSAYICTWSVGRFPVSPVWFDKRNGGGNLVDPTHDCVTCACFEKGRPV